MAFRSSAIASASVAGTLTATPTGVAAHDYLLALYTIDFGSGANDTMTPPSGWSQQVNVDFVTATPDGQEVWLADKNDATGSDAFGFTDSDGNGGGRALICSAWTGRNNTTPLSITPTTTKNTTANASPISATLNGITAQAGDDVAVFAGTDQTDAGGRWTFSQITSYTERNDGVNTDWVSGIGLQTQDAVGAGATGNFSTTITNGGSGAGAGYWAIVVAIKAVAATYGVNRPWLQQILDEPIAGTRELMSGRWF
jgi:hypothetical protein